MHSYAKATAVRARTPLQDYAQQALRDLLAEGSEHVTHQQDADGVTRTRLRITLTRSEWSQFEVMRKQRNCTWTDIVRTAIGGDR